MSQSQSLIADLSHTALDKLTTKTSLKTIFAIVIGNALEWYDFVVYSFMTIFIAKLFFPLNDPTNSLLATTAAFGVAFCMRPLGGIAFGIYADKKGRKIAMTWVIAVMTIATFIITIAPIYTQVGILAPILIVVARLLQGFSAGGEFGTSTALLIELSPEKQRGYYGSWQMVGQVLSMLLATSTGALLTAWLSATQIESWGWRLPFLLGLIIAPVGIYLRQHLSEPVNPQHALTSSREVFEHQFKRCRYQMLIAMGLVVGGSVATYTIITYMPTYVTHYLHLSMHMSFQALIIGTLVMVILMPLFGILSDRFGRKPILVISILCCLLSSYPLFHWLSAAPSFTRLVTVQFIFCSFLSAYFSVFPATLVELFPKAVRSTGLGISYNFTVMLFGGFAQFIVTWLISVLGTPLAMTYYLIFSLIISFIAALFYQDKQRNEYT